jgi:hypothetical protein
MLRCAASLKQGQLGREQVFELARSCSECCRFCTTEPSNSTSTSAVTAPFARKVDAPSNVAATLLVDTLKLMKQFEEHGMFKKKIKIVLNVYMLAHLHLRCLCHSVHQWQISVFNTQAGMVNDFSSYHCNLLNLKPVRY